MKMIVINSKYKTQNTKYTQTHSINAMLKNRTNYKIRDQQSIYIIIYVWLLAVGSWREPVVTTA